MTVDLEWQTSPMRRNLVKNLKELFHQYKQKLGILAIAIVLSHIVLAIKMSATAKNTDFVAINELAPSPLNIDWDNTTPSKFKIESSRKVQLFSNIINRKIQGDDLRRHEQKSKEWLEIHNYICITASQFGVADDVTFMKNLTLINSEMKEASPGERTVAEEDLSGTLVWRKRPDWIKVFAATPEDVNAPYFHFLYKDQAACWMFYNL